MGCCGGELTSVGSGCGEERGRDILRFGVVRPLAGLSLPWPLAGRWRSLALPSLSPPVTDEEPEGVVSVEMVLPSVLGLPLAVDGRPVGSGDCDPYPKTLLSVSNCDVLARGDMNVLIFAISLNLVCCKRFGLWCENLLLTIAPACDMSARMTSFFSCSARSRFDHVLFLYSKVGMRKTRSCTSSRFLFPWPL